jgi:hypothetical protein
MSATVSRDRIVERVQRQRVQLSVTTILVRHYNQR